MTKEELEKKAEEWIAKNSKEFITNPNYSPFDYAKAIYLAGAEPREKQIAELEKENAELKGLVNQYKASKCSGISLVNRNMIMSDQLTKAKKLLTRFVMASVYFNGKETDLVEEAEQFLNSEGK